MSSIKPVLRYPGAKWRIADWIVEQLPPHRGYVEPFAGSAAVLFRKPRAVVECINDLDVEIVNFFTMLRDQPETFARAVELTPYARSEYDLSFEPTDDPIERARRWLVRCTFSHAAKLGSISGMKVGADGIRTGMATGCPARTWATWPDRLLAAADRFRGVQIEHRPAIDVIAGWNQRGTLLYCDPPYLTSTLASGDDHDEAGKWARCYRHTMTDDDHAELLSALDRHPGPVVLSGYRNDLYDDRLNAWRRVERSARAYSNARRVECLWMNPVAADMARQQPLMDVAS